MKYYLKTIYPLVLISVISGGLLGLTYELLSPMIREVQQKEEQSALKGLFPSGDRFVLSTNNGRQYYIAYDTTGEITGYVVKASEVGYGGPVVSLIGVSKTGTVDALTVLSAEKETPGLGTICKDKRWLKQFNGLTSERLPKNKMDFRKKKLDVITGATITSMAVIRNLGIAFQVYDAVKPVPVINTNSLTNTITNQTPRRTRRAYVR